MANENEKEEVTLQEQEIQVQKKETENAPKGYKRVDIEGGILTDEDEISYFKTIQKREVLNNHMLGDFNANGDYVIKEPMMKELVIMKKFLIDSYFNNVYFVKSALITREVGNIQFCVMVKTSKDGNKATAILKLLEPITKAGGYIQNTNSFTVATYTDDNDDYFMSKVKKVFNIHPIEEADVKQDEEEVAEIIARLSMRSKTKLLGASVYAKIEKEHYDNRISILKQGGFDDVLEELNTLMEKAKVFLNPSDPNYYRTINDLIDQAIDNVGKKHPNRMKDVKKALLAANKDYIGKCEEAEDVIKGYKEKADVKERLEKEAAAAAKLAREKEEAAKAAAQQKKPAKKADSKSKSKPKAKKPAAKKPAKKPAAKKDDYYTFSSKDLVKEYEEQIKVERKFELPKEPVQPEPQPVKETDKIKGELEKMREFINPQKAALNNTTGREAKANAQASDLLQQVAEESKTPKENSDSTKVSASLKLKDFDRQQ